MSELCSGCGRAVAGGTQGCRAEFDALVGRDFSDPRFFASHRLFVDIYALQHPDEFCRSAKSLAAHLCGLGLILEGGASAATAPPRCAPGSTGRASDKRPCRRGGGSPSPTWATSDDTPRARRAQGWRCSTWALERPSCSGAGMESEAKAGRREDAAGRIRSSPLLRSAVASGFKGATMAVIPHARFTRTAPARRPTLARCDESCRSISTVRRKRRSKRHRQRRAIMARRGRPVRNRELVPPPGGSRQASHERAERWSMNGQHFKPVSSTAAPISSGGSLPDAATKSPRCLWHISAPRSSGFPQYRRGYVTGTHPSFGARAGNGRRGLRMATR